jgi:hypothetical protein
LWLRRVFCLGASGALARIMCLYRR